MYGSWVSFHYKNTKVWLFYIVRFVVYKIWLSEVMDHCQNFERNEWQSQYSNGAQSLCFNGKSIWMHNFIHTLKTCLPIRNVVQDLTCEIQHKIAWNKWSFTCYYPQPVKHSKFRFIFDAAPRYQQLSDRR